MGPLLVCLLLLLGSPAAAQIWGEGGGGAAAQGGTLYQYDLIENDTVTPMSLGLEFSVEANRYYNLNCALHASATNTNTAIRFGVTGPAAADVDFNVVNWTASNAYTLIGYVGFGFTQPTLLSSQGPISRLYQISGIFRASANGTVAVTVESEVAGIFVTVYPGSLCSYYYGEVPPP